MDRYNNQGSGRAVPPVKTNAKATPASHPAPASSAKRAARQGNDPLIEKIRQIIEETEEIRPEKVDPLQEALDQGEYEIDAQKVANCLISELFLKF